MRTIYSILAAMGVLIAASCSNAQVTDFSHVTVLELQNIEGDITMIPVECDPLTTGRIIENYQDSTIIATINGDRKKFTISGNYLLQDGVLVVLDEKQREYLFAKDSLSTGEPIMFIQGGSIVFAFCDKPHPCNEATK